MRDDEKPDRPEPAAEDEEVEIEFVDVDEYGREVDPPEGEAETDASFGPGVEEEGEVGRLRKELDELRDVYMRKLAEFDNFRKRTERERREQERTAGEDVVRELLPVLDNFERALHHAADDNSRSFQQGVEMIHKQLKDVLERKGLEPIDPGGERFEPEFHEAVQRVEDGDLEHGTVAWVLAKGYLYGGKLLRPAMVAVAVGSSSGDGQGNDASGSGSEGGQ